MKKLLVAAAFCLAVPAVAHAQDEPKMACCEKMKEGQGCDCCKDMEGHEGEAGHAETESHAH